MKPIFSYYHTVSPQMCIFKLTGLLITVQKRKSLRMQKPEDGEE